MQTLLPILAYGLVLIGCASVTFACARARSDWVAVLSVLLPMVSAGLTYLAWSSERHSSAGGDPQPGLVLLIGAVVTGALLFGTLAGIVTHVRRRR